MTCFRDRSVQIDGVEQLNNILLIGMTNRLDMIDEALLRPGRLEVKMEIGEEGRERGREGMKRGRRIMYKHIDFAGTVYSPLNIVHVVLSCPGLPDEAGRLEILNIHTAQMKSHGKLHPNVDIVNLASRTRNFSGAEIEGLVRSAQATAMNKMIQVHCMHVCVFIEHWGRLCLQYVHVYMIVLFWIAGTHQYTCK